MTQRYQSSIVSALLLGWLVCFAGGTFAASDDRLWQDRFDRGARRHGSAAPSDRLSNHPLIANKERQASSEPGVLLWDDRFDRGGGRNEANAVAVMRSQAFVVGFGATADDKDEWVVRAYKVRDGTLLWNDQFDNGGGASEARAVAVKNRQIFVVGLGKNSKGAFEWIVRAYRAQTGTLLWEDRFDNGGGLNDALTIAVNKSRIFVAGVGNSADGIFEWIVRAYDPRTGSLVWNDAFELGGGGRAFALATQGARVFVGGLGRTADDALIWVARAYNAKSGALLWSDQFENGGDWGDVRAVATKGSRSFFGGFSNTADNSFEGIVRAHNSGTGALVWDDAFNQGGNDNQINVMTVRGRRLFSGGFGFTEQGADEWVARAYDTKTGALIWHDHFDNGGGNSEANALAANGGRVYLGGFGKAPNEAFQWIVRAHNARSGHLLWNDRFDNGGGDNEVNALAAKQSRVLAVGSGKNSAGSREWIVRVYRR